MRCLVMLLVVACAAVAAVAQESRPLNDIPEWEVPVDLGEEVYAFDESSPKARKIIEAALLVRADELRVQEKVTGAGMSVAVIDSGLDRNHCDFKAVGKVVAVHNYTAADGGKPDVVIDRRKHGTHITGIIAASSKKRVGIAPDAKIVVLKVLEVGIGAPDDAIRDALQWVIDKGAAHNTKVVNISLGRMLDTGEAINAEIQTRIRTLRKNGVAVVISSGNLHLEFPPEAMSHPAIIAESISVGGIYDADIGRDVYPNGAKATTTRPDRFMPIGQRLHPTTNALQRTDIFAPGALINSSLAGTPCKTGTMRGTSQAAPIVSGVVLLLQEYALKKHGRYATVDEIETAIIKSGRLHLDARGNHDDNVVHTEKQFPILDAIAAAKELSLVIVQNDLARIATAYRKMFPQ